MEHSVISLDDDNHTVRSVSKRPISIISQVSQKHDLNTQYRQLPTSQDYNFLPTQQTSQIPAQSQIQNFKAQNVVNNYNMFYSNHLVAQTQQAIKRFLLSQGRSETQVLNSLMQIGNLAQLGTTNFQKAYQGKLINSNSNPNPQPPKEVQQQKIGRIKRMNIPKTTLINKKTGQVVDNSPYTGDYSLQHIEDRQIVQKINRLLIEGGWKYSSLLGRQNKPAFDLQGSKALKDDDFPQILVIISPQMRNNFQHFDGSRFAHIIQGTHKIKKVQNAMSYGLTPTNSRYFIFGIFGLSKNLQPILFGIAFASDKILQIRKDEAYFQILKTLIQANNEQLTQKRRQLAAKKKLLGRKIREPEIIAQDSFIFPQVIFCSSQKQMISACQRLKIQYGINFEVYSSFSFRLHTMKEKFKRHELKKQALILQKSEIMIKKMLQTNNPKEIQDGITWLNQYNEDFRRKYRQYQLSKLCFYNFQKRLIGFHSFQRYQTPMLKILNDLVVQKSAQTLKQFLDILTIQQQKIKKKLYNEPFIDKYGLLKYNNRLKKLLLIVQPKVMQQITDIYKYSLSLKCIKDPNNQYPKYIIGSGKGIKKTNVEFIHHIWKCQCGFQIKIGIPCVHLFKVLHTQKGTKYQDYIHSKHYKVRQTGIVQLQ